MTGEVVSVLDRHELPLDVPVVRPSALLHTARAHRLYIGQYRVELWLKVSAQSIWVALGNNLLNFQVSLHVFVQDRDILGPG